MKQQIDLEVRMKSDKYEYQLADDRQPDEECITDECINSVVALMVPRDSRQCASEKNKLPLFFFRTYFMDNLVHLGFENDSRVTYSKATKYAKATNNARKWCKNVFGHEKLFVPIHIVDNRFILAVICILEKRIVFYDTEPSSDTTNYYKTILINYLRKEYHLITGSPLPLEWTQNESQSPVPTYNNEGTLFFCYCSVE